MSRPIMDDELLFKNRSGSPSGESENTETWVRRAMLTTPESFAETVTSPDAETKQTPQTNTQPQDNKQTKSHPHSSPLQKLWTCKGRQSGEDGLLQPSAVVEATMVCNSRDNLEIEVTQGWAESDSDDELDDGSTAATYPSHAMAALPDKLVNQSLVQLVSEDSVKCIYTFTQLHVSVKDNQSGWTKALSMPLDLLLVERGAATLVCNNAPGKARSFATPVKATAKKVDLIETNVDNLYESPDKKSKKPMEQQIQSEVGWIGQIWRSILIWLLLCTLDVANRLRLSRALQVALPFMTGYEAYLLATVIEGLDQMDRSMKTIWKRAFSNRNVSRVIVQALRPRYNFLYHWGTAITWNRLYDIIGQIPIIGVITRFPATENFPSTRNHALASILRVVLGKGNWITRLLTGGREGLITDDPNAAAQNLTAESNGFELANRNQYGTHIGRMYTNKFRFDHRLPTDESLVRTFFTQPMSTVTNNGVVHSLRHLAKHWNRILSLEFGNFAHQRMEQLNPFETLRFHIPEILVLLSSLRGRNVWDAHVLGPVIQKLERLPPDASADRARRLVRLLQRKVVVPVCGGIASVVEPFQSWLDAITKSLDMIEEEAKEVYNLVASVDLGIRLGYDIMSQTSWKVPPDGILKKAILKYIRGEHMSDKHGITENQIAEALDRTTPRDKRTLIELVQKNQESTIPARMLLGRVKTLLQREIRRDFMNGAIHALSKGDHVGAMVEDRWYWLENDGKYELFSYVGKNGKKHQFIHINSGAVRSVTSDTEVAIVARAYIPVAEAISRAQKMFMTIELNHGGRFSYNAFMEFTPLRVTLRRLIIVSQMACEALDNARLNFLSEIQRTQEVKDNPQNLVIVGGGPGGMIAAIHCTENCLIGGGVVKLFEARDSFAKGGSTYERAQIVRLDARWIAMMRYHCGTGFEDVYIPASGETDSQLGNTLPTQGFVELTIKDLENMLHVEISRYWSRGLISVFTDSRSRFDHITNSLTKLGENLKVGDVIARHCTSDDDSSTEGGLWKVVELVYTKLLEVDDLRVGEEYGLYYRPQMAVLPFKLTAVDLTTKDYLFESVGSNFPDLCVNIKDLPSVYPAGTSLNAHADVHEVIIESLERNDQGRFCRESLMMDAIKMKKYKLHVGKTHVIEAIGKPSDSQVHLRVVTPEPHGVCCLEGLKVSFGMHKFGEKRWGAGILDDIRSHNDNNTRIIGDFTKMVRTAPIVELMHELVSKDKHWMLHFEKLVADSTLPELNDLGPFTLKIATACSWLAANSKRFKRATLQTRFFETGDNFYLGMEIPREFDRWKTDLAAQIVAELHARDLVDGRESECAELQQSLLGGIDRLWYSACLEVIRTGDVYAPGARHRVPKMFVIDSGIPEQLGNLGVGESFRLLDDPEERYEILDKRFTNVTVRNIEGYIQTLPKSSQVYRQSNLTKGPDGNQESKVAISTFPVTHYINHRTMRMGDNGYVFAFIGDEQASPHFMRYSGLTGAGINAMSFNEFVRRANEGEPLVRRFCFYSKETNWSNCEVVTRGTVGDFGDGFLRPGIFYSDGIDYLYSKIIEYQESGQNLTEILSTDWLRKMAAAFVPRGMELNRDFLIALRKQWQDNVFHRTAAEIRNDETIQDIEELEDAFRARMEDMSLIEPCSDGYWTTFLLGLKTSREKRKQLTKHIEVASFLNLICNQITDYAAKASLYNDRNPSELVNQPLPVDSIVDNFAVEAQTFANALTISAALGACTLALQLLDSRLAALVSAISGGLNILFAFGTMTDVSRYKIRNEEARILFKDKKFHVLKESVFSLLNRKTRKTIHRQYDPVLSRLKDSARRFRSTAIYQGFEEPLAFDELFTTVLQDGYNVSKLKLFKRYVAQELMADTYHVNSYVQDSLVEMYRNVEEMISLISKPKNDVERTNFKAKGLFVNLVHFEERLESSLQRGPVLWGFLKSRRFVHWDISIVVRYLYSLFWTIIPFGNCSIAPIEHQTANVLRQLRSLSNDHEKKCLRREIRDVESLYWATRESDIASLIFVSSFLTFVTSIIFSVARLVGIDYLVNLAFFSAAASALGAILAVSHLIRKFFILFRLWILLCTKGKKIAAPFRSDLRLVRQVTLTQIFLTVARLGAASAAAVALPFSVAETGYGDRIRSPAGLSLWFALGSIVAALGSTIVFLLVEYVVRYRLSTELGPFVCYLFREEIAAILAELTVEPGNTVDTQQARDRELWEYTARKFLHRYRFDTVFAADRFGQILQFLQAEMKNVHHSKRKA